MITMEKMYKNVKIEQLNVLVILSFAILIIAYLFMTNNVAIATYKKVTLQKHIENLRTEIKILNLELSDKRSIGFLKKAAGRLNLVVNENIQYIKITGPVAKNQ